MTPPVIETHGLRKEFGDKVAVAELSLVVRSGEIFGFLGPNGAGKTTSLKMLLGLVRPTAGAARVLERPLGDRRARARIGFLPEHFRFQDWLSGRELLELHGRLGGVPAARRRAQTDELLARVDLLDAAHRRLRDYSKGMLQRIGLAQALLGEPKLVFLDEPTSGLDPLGRRLVRDLIGELRARGVAVFLNSHLLGEVEQTCDRVVFLKQGRTVHELPLAAAEAAALTVELRLGPHPPALLADLARFGRCPREEDGLVRLEVERDDVLPELSRWLVGQGLALYELRSQRKSLETWFLEVMGEDQRPG
ncbi:MAG TPA: ABC transporter ATP-binding protein [Terriglobales bacterium]|nr:ABC transporter ATP-binding protein [Terriglobales bacterium]